MYMQHTFGIISCVLIPYTQWYVHYCVVMLYPRCIQGVFEWYYRSEGCVYYNVIYTLLQNTLECISVYNVQYTLLCISSKFQYLQMRYKGQVRKYHTTHKDMARFFCYILVSKFSLSIPQYKSCVGVLSSWQFQLAYQVPQTNLSFLVSGTPDNGL